MELAEINEVLLDAFSKDELQRLVKFGLHEDLSQISESSNLKTQVYQLTTWALRNNRLEDLLNYAKVENPDHEGLKKLHYSPWVSKAYFSSKQPSQHDLYVTLFGIDGTGGLRKLVDSNQHQIRELSITMYEFHDRVKRIERMFYIGSVVLVLLTFSFIIGFSLR